MFFCALAKPKKTASKKNNLPVCLFNAIYDKENVHPEFDIKSLIDIKNIIDEV